MDKLPSRLLATSCRWWGPMLICRRAGPGRWWAHAIAWKWWSGKGARPPVCGRSAEPRCCSGRGCGGRGRGGSGVVGRRRVLVGRGARLFRGSGAFGIALGGVALVGALLRLLRLLARFGGVVGDVPALPFEDERRWRKQSAQRPATDIAAGEGLGRNPLANFERGMALIALVLVRWHDSERYMRRT